jgi:thiamine-monophosphate kinase
MSLGEFDLIARYFAAHGTRSDLLLGIGDDAAVVESPPHKRLVIAMDTVVEGVHFLTDADPRDVGYRVLAVNLSDIAAMGAIPSWMTLSLSLPRSDEAWVRGFAEGLFELAREHNVALIGGDTVKGPLVVTIQIAGYVESDRWLMRSGARPGDLLFVSGVPGEAAGGLALMKRDGVTAESEAESEHLRGRFLRPQPRILLGRELRTVASAAMDISDGLLTDLDKLCAASSCGARVQIERLPKSQAMQAMFDQSSCIEYSLAGGDDYELLFTVPSERVDSIAGLSVSCTQIGEITSDRHVVCELDGKAVNIAHRGYDHFIDDAVPHEVDC